MRTVSCGNKVLLLLPHLSDGLTGGIVEQVAWPFRGSSDLARLVSDVSLAFVVTRGGVAGQGEVDALEQGFWSEGGGYVFLPGLRRWDEADLDPR